MSNFVRREDLEDAIKDCYDFDCTVYKRKINRESYEVKLVKGTQECILKEVMDRGVTKTVTLQLPDNTMATYAKYKTAEEDAVELLRS